jgi:hypothetical protein
MATPFDGWLDSIDQDADPERPPSPLEDREVDFYEDSEAEELTDQQYSDIEAWRDDIEEAGPPSVDEVIDYESSEDEELDDEKYSEIETWRHDVEDDYVEPYPPNDEDEDRYGYDD